MDQLVDPACSIVYGLSRFVAAISPCDQVSDVVHSIAFTAEQMSKLSDILEAALPRSTSSPAGSRSTSITPDLAQPNVRRPLQASHKGNTVNVPVELNPFGDLAKEFGVDSNLVEALAHRLSRIP